MTQQPLNNNKAIVVFSGGQDSTTCLFWAKKHFDEVVLVTFEYGQRHDTEIQVAKQIAKEQESNTMYLICHYYLNSLLMHSHNMTSI